MPTFIPDAKGGSGKGAFVPDHTPGLTSSLGIAPKTAREITSHAHPGALPTPLRAVLDAASVPAYAVGQAVLHPTDKRTWTASGLDLFRDESRHVMPGQALRQRGALNWIPTSYGLRSVAALIGDIGLDPATWISGGGGAAAHVAEGAGQVAARNIGLAGAEYLAAQRAAHGTVTLSDKARAAAMTAAERKGAQGTLKLSVRLPFTRGREVLIGESARAHDLVSAVGGKLATGELSKLAAQGLTTGRGLDPVVREVHRAVAAGARAEVEKIATAAARLERDVHGAEKGLGLKRGEGLTAISRHLGNPQGARALPTGLEDYAATARDLLDEFNAAEKAAGILYEERPHYVSFLGATPADRKVIANLYASPAASHLDEPFFVHPSVARSMDQFEAIAREQGFTPELNIARIVERRGRASVGARMKKALDEAVVGAEGVKPPAVEIPGTAKLDARVSKHTTALAEAVASGDTEAARVAQRKLDIAHADLAKRERKIATIAAGNESLAARPGRTATPEEWKAVRTQWTEMANATKYHAGTRLPPHVAESLKRVHERIAPTVASEAALADMGRRVANITARWKSLALLSPGYHVRNAYDDGMRAYWAGARNPQSYNQAVHILRTGSGKGASDSVYRIRGKTFTRAQLARMAEDHDVIDTGFARIETHSSVEATGRARIAAPGEGHAARASRAVGQWRENVIRLGTWLEMLKRGENPAEAARIVREFVFDYSETSAFIEEARKLWAPFATYPSKAIPFVAKEFARRPGRAANLNAAMTTLNQGGGNPDLSLLPAGAQSSFGVPWSDALRRPLGAPTGQPMLVNPERLFSFGSLNLLDPRLSRLRQNYLGGLLNPAARAVLEVLTHRSMYLGSDLPKLAKAPTFVNRLAEAGVPIPTYVAPGAEGGKRDFYTGRPVGGYSAYLDGLARLVPVYGQAASLIPGGTDSAQIGAARFFLGLPVTPYDRARALARVQRFGNP